MPKVLVTTVPFCTKDRHPINLLEKAGIEYLINPLNKKLTEIELYEMISNFDAIIAGTEPITENVMRRGKNLKIISRVGIGLDSVDLLATKKHGIAVSFTPDAPAPAVAELTIGFMLSLLRSIQLSNTEMPHGNWERYFGRRLSDVTIGIIGLGRIGKRVLKHLQGFAPKRVLLNDISQDENIESEFRIEWTDKEQLLQEADIVTIHTPLTSLTKNMFKKEHLLTMKKDALIINTARGGIINESDLFEVLQKGHLSGAAIDVFNTEPYDGPLGNIQRCILTSHMGSMSIDCRIRMEIEATEEVVRFLTNKPLKSIVPLEEYAVQRQGL